MSGKLVPTVFQTGPDDELMAVDVYKGGGGNTYGGTESDSSYDAKRDEAIDIVDQIKEQITNDNGDNFAQSQNSEKGTEPYNASEAFKRMAGESSAIIGFLNNLSNTARDLFKLLPESSSIKTNNGTNLNNSLSIKDVTSIVGIIGSLSNNNFTTKVTDQGATKELITSSVVSASKIGINGGFQAISKNPSIPKEVLVSAASDSIRQTLSDGNLGVALDVIQSDVSKDVLRKDPGLINQILKTTSLSSESKEKRTKLFSLFVDAFEKADENWNKSNRGNQTVIDLKGRELSKDLSDLLKTEVMSLPLGILVSKFSQINSAIDFQLSDRNNDFVFFSIYNDQMEEEQKQPILADWNNLNNLSVRDKHFDYVKMYAASIIPSMSIQEELDKYFPLLGKVVGLPISR
jgi:hypothetical protein